jgi:hypothetical protein
MPENAHAVAPALSPHVQLMQMALGPTVTQIVRAAAELCIADHLETPKTAEQVSADIGAHAPSLHRMMRTLSSLGILTQTDDGCFALTPVGEALKIGAPGDARSMILTLASDWWSRGLEQLPYSVRTGKSGFEKALGMPIFEWIGKDPERASMFSGTMVGVHGLEPVAVARALDFFVYKTIVDVGGATGNLLGTILAAHAGPRGILFDMPHVVRDAPALLQARGVGDRIAIQAGSFFENVPEGGDAYLLSHVIHDWSEEQCFSILRNCHRAMTPASKLLVIEMVLPPGDAPHPGKTLDMVMLVGPGGQERTAPEYEALLGKAGFRVTRVVPTESAVSVVEAVHA